MTFTGRTYGVKGARRGNPAQYRFLSARAGDYGQLKTESRAELMAILRAEIASAKTAAERAHAYDQVTDLMSTRTITAQQGEALLDALGFTKRSASRRPNPPMLAILNPLPAHLERFAKAQRLTADERAEFHQAIARYCEFHDVEPADVSLEPWGEVEGEGTRFLVGLGKAEDVSYSANTKGRFRGSNKQGTPFRHVIEAEGTMLATTPDGEMSIIINKPGAKKKLVVRDWMRG